MSTAHHQPQYMLFKISNLSLEAESNTLHHKLKELTELLIQEQVPRSQLYINNVATSCALLCHTTDKVFAYIR